MDKRKSLVQERLKLFEGIAIQQSEAVRESQRFSLKKQISIERDAEQNSSDKVKKTWKEDCNRSLTKNNNNITDSKKQEKDLRTNQIHNDVNSYEECKRSNASVLNNFERNTKYNFNNRSIEKIDNNSPFRFLVENLTKCVAERNSVDIKYLQSAQSPPSCRMHKKATIHDNLRLKIFEKTSVSDEFNIEPSIIFENKGSECNSLLNLQEIKIKNFICNNSEGNNLIDNIFDTSTNLQENQTPLSYSDDDITNNTETISSFDQSNLQEIQIRNDISNVFDGHGNKNFVNNIHLNRVKRLQEKILNTSYPEKLLNVDFLSKQNTTMR